MEVEKLAAELSQRLADDPSPSELMGYMLVLLFYTDSKPTNIFDLDSVESHIVRNYDSKELSHLMKLGLLIIEKMRASDYPMDIKLVMVVDHAAGLTAVLKEEEYTDADAISSMFSSLCNPGGN